MLMSCRHAQKKTSLYLHELYILKQSSFKRIKFTLLICSLMQQDLPKSNQAIYSIGRTSGVKCEVSIKYLLFIELLCSCDSLPQGTESTQCPLPSGSRLCVSVNSELVYMKFT